VSDAPRLEPTGIALSRQLAELFPSDRLAVADPPAVTVRIRLEGAPRLEIEADDQAAFDRLFDWIGSNEELHLIVALAELSASRLDSK
jgi:hypothetical protein